MFAAIAPPLFVEGTHVSRTKLLEYRKTYTINVNGTSVCNCSRSWLFYTLDLVALLSPAAFGNRAILGPIDAVAAFAITRENYYPKVP